MAFSVYLFRRSGRLPSVSNRKHSVYTIVAKRRFLFLPVRALIIARHHLSDGVCGTVAGNKKLRATPLQTGVFLSTENRKVFTADAFPVVPGASPPRVRHVNDKSRLNVSLRVGRGKRREGNERVSFNRNRFANGKSRDF